MLFAANELDRLAALKVDRWNQHGLSIGPTSRTCNSQWSGSCNCSERLTVAARPFGDVDFDCIGYCVGINDNRDDRRLQGYVPVEHGEGFFRRSQSRAYVK